MAENKSIKLHTGCTVSGRNVDEAVTQKEWLEEGKKKFGEDIKQWKFICPKCSHVASVKDFIDIGEDANSSFQECIGRHKEKIGTQDGCDWAAYGFFGTAGKGRIVIDESGLGTEVFQFAEEKGE